MYSTIIDSNYIVKHFKYFIFNKPINFQVKSFLQAI